MKYVVFQAYQAAFYKSIMTLSLKIFFQVLTTLTVLRDTLSILLEGSPADVKYDDVHRDLSNIGDVVGVHSLHIWSLTADIPVVSAHLTTKNETVDHNGIRNEAIK